MSPTAGLAGFPALLVDRGRLSRSDLMIAQQHAQREHMELADALVALGLIREEESYQALAAAAGLELVDLSTAESSELAVRLVPERIARQHMAVALRVDNRTLTCATCRPFDPEAERDLSFASGRRPGTVVAQRSTVLEALDRCYPKQRELDVLATRLSAERPVVENADASIETTGSESTVIDLCNHLLGRAVDVGASDVHVECGSQGTTVRYRICGVLEPVLTLPAAVSHPIRNRFKIMARADIAVHHRPQDGAFRLKVNGRAIDVRLSTLPTVDGEKIVMRVIDSQSPLQSLERLGYDDDTLTRLQHDLGRVPVAEFLTPSDELRDAIVRGATAHEIRAAMRSSGCPTMRDRALALVAQGVTCIEEVDRVLTDDPSRAAGHTQRRVLVTDDEPITRMLVKLLLEREHFQVLEATNGRDAVEIATRERPDLLLIDLNMPEMDGYEAIGRLRRDLSLATLPILVITSEDGPGVERRVLELGADDYIVKPFDPDILLSRVNAVFRRLKVMAA